MLRNFNNPNCILNLLLFSKDKISLKDGKKERKMNRIKEFLKYIFFDNTNIFKAHFIPSQAC